MIKYHQCEKTPFCVSQERFRVDANAFVVSSAKGISEDGAVSSRSVLDEYKGDPVLYLTGRFPHMTLHC